MADWREFRFNIGFIYTAVPESYADYCRTTVNDWSDETLGNDQYADSCIVSIDEVIDALQEMVMIERE